MSFRAEAGPTLDGTDGAEKSGHAANKADLPPGFLNHYVSFLHNASSEWQPQSRFNWIGDGFSPRYKHISKRTINFKSTSRGEMFKLIG